jgi:hypothetical protein
LEKIEKACDDVLSGAALAVSEVIGDDGAGA